MVLGANAVGHGDNIIVLGNADHLAIHPGDDNGVDLGSGAYSFKNAYIQGTLSIGDTSGSTYFALPTTTGTSGQILKVPSSGNVLEWGTGTGVDFYQASGTLIVGNSNTPSGTAEYNVGMGDQALDSLTTGGKNVAIGYDAGTAITQGSGNVLIGFEAGNSITTGGDHIAIGRKALQAEDTSTSSSIAIGALALTNQNSGTFNVGIGNDAGGDITSGDNNVVIGGTQTADALQTGNYNIAMGGYALSAEDATDGSVAIGHKSLLVQDGGSMNVSIGYEAGDVVSTGAENVIIGSQAAGTLTTGGNNVVIGRRAEVAAAGNDDCIVIGASAAGAGSNTTVIGTTGTTNARVFGLRTFVTATTADTSLTAADSGETFVFNDTAATFTLPDSGAGDLTGVYFNFIVLDDTAGTKRIACADTTNEDLIGSVMTVDTDTSDANASFAVQVADEFHQITFNGTTTGRAGSKVTVTNIAADKWHVEGTLLCTGAPATPFS